MRITPTVSLPASADVGLLRHYIDVAQGAALILSSRVCDCVNGKQARRVVPCPKIRGESYEQAIATIKKGITGTATRTVALSMACIAIAACSKGEGVQLGTGQDPDPVVIDFPIAYIKSPIPTDDNGVFRTAGPA